MVSLIFPFYKSAAGLTIRVLKSIQAKIERAGIQLTDGNSHFWFTVKFAVAPTAQLPLASETSGPISSGRTGRRRILLAEDSSTNQIVIGSMLKKLGFSCHIVANGREALAAYQNHQYDLILMDCQMPEMDGYEATKRIRELEKHTREHIPILTITANVQIKDRVLCEQSGMDEVIGKPVGIHTLGKVLEVWSERSS